MRLSIESRRAVFSSKLGQVIKALATFAAQGPNVLVLNRLEVAPTGNAFSNLIDFGISKLILASTSEWHCFQRTGEPKEPSFLARLSAHHFAGIEPTVRFS